MPGRPFVLLFSLKEADFQGDAHRMCCFHSAHPVADMQAGGGYLGSRRRGGLSRGWIWISPTTRGNQMPLDTRPVTGRAGGSDHWGCLIRS